MRSGLKTLSLNIVIFLLNAFALIKSKISAAPNLRRNFLIITPMIVCFILGFIAGDSLRPDVQILNQQLQFAQNNAEKSLANQSDSITDVATQIAPSVDTQMAALSAITPEQVQQAIIPSTAAKAPQDPQQHIADSRVSSAKQERVAEIQRGDTLVRLLIRNGIGAKESYAIARSMGPVYNLRRIKPGQAITLTFKNCDQGPEFSELFLNTSEGKNICIAKNDSGIYVPTVTERSYVQDTKYVEGVVKTTFLAATQSAGVPRNLISNVVRSFSSDINFKKDIRSGTKFCVLYETLTDKETGDTKKGAILHASVQIGATTRKIYRHKELNGQIRYVDERGETVTKGGRMCQPVSYTRVSSNFGMRFHPILKCRKMHNGIDLAAPHGRVVKAPGPGRVIKACWMSGYGKTVKIKHDNGLYSLCGHLSAITVKQGQRVTMGQQIGRVGKTGRATAPHVHFEIRNSHDRPINPRGVKSLQNTKLATKELQRFRSGIRKLNQQIESIRTQPGFNGTGTYASKISTASSGSTVVEKTT